MALSSILIFVFPFKRAVSSSDSSLDPWFVYMVTLSTNCVARFATMFAGKDLDVIPWVARTPAELFPLSSKPWQYRQW